MIGKKTKTKTSLRGELVSSGGTRFIIVSSERTVFFLAVPLPLGGFKFAIPRYEEKLSAHSSASESLPPLTEADLEVGSNRAR